MSNSNITKRLDRLRTLCADLNFECESTISMAGVLVIVRMPDDDLAHVLLKHRRLGSQECVWNLVYEGSPAGGSDDDMHTWLESLRRTPDNVIRFPKP